MFSNISIVQYKTYRTKNNAKLLSFSTNEVWSFQFRGDGGKSSKHAFRSIRS